MTALGRASPESARVLALLMRILRDGGRVALQEQARSLGLPLSTTYRLVSRLKEAGLVRRCGRGAFSAGLELVQLTAKMKPRQLLVQIARPHLKRLAGQLLLTVHLGILEEDMVTYLVKEHGGGPKLFTRSGTQLEAYCSAIGKVLLAALPDSELERYLGAGPMVPLTANTISRPDQLRNALATIRSEGYAVDAEEVIENLRCIAVPIHDRNANVVAAVSVSQQIEAANMVGEDRILAALRAYVCGIEEEL